MKKTKTAAPGRINGPLRRAALKLPDAEEGVACKGTAVESVTVKARGKAFLFLRPGQVMLKLCESVAEATKLAAKAGASLRVGSGGWTTIQEDGGPSPSEDLLKRWLNESYRTVVEAPAAKTTSTKTPKTQRTASPSRKR